MEWRFAGINGWSARYSNDVGDLNFWEAIAMIQTRWLENERHFWLVHRYAHYAFKHRWISFWFSAFAVCFLNACGNAFPHPPVSYPFSVIEKNAILNRNIRIVEHRAYVIELKFELPDGEDMPKLRSLLTGGNRTVDKKYFGAGVPIPVKVGIFRLDNGGETPVFESVVTTKGAYSWSTTEIVRLVAQVNLTPAQYRLQFINLEAKPEFSNAKVSLVIGIPPKTTSIEDK